MSVGAGQGVLRAWVTGASVWAAGLRGWAEAGPVLAGKQPYVTGGLDVPAPTILSSTERRRTSRVTRLALAAASDAVAQSGIAPAQLRPVFGSANGDGTTVSSILEALSRPAGQVSPTQFHNSVHNAAAGYWSIGTASAQPALCLGCHDSTWAAALLAALAETRAGTPVLLVVYDAALPPPLDAVRPTADAFAAALVLSPTKDGVPIAARHVAEPGETWPLDPSLHALFRGNPAARALPVMAALAAGRATPLSAAYLEGRLDIEVG